MKQMETQRISSLFWRQKLLPIWEQMKIEIIITVGLNVAFKKSFQYEITKYMKIFVTLYWKMHAISLFGNVRS